VIAKLNVMKVRILTTMIPKDSNSNKINNKDYMRKKLVSVGSHKIV